MCKEVEIFISVNVYRSVCKEVEIFISVNVYCSVCKEVEIFQSMFIALCAKKKRYFSQCLLLCVPRSGDI